MKIPKYLLVLGLFVNNSYSEMLVITNPNLQRIFGPQIYIVSGASEQANKNKEILLKTNNGAGLCLQGVNLMGADLKNANLEKANLRGAILIETNLTGANLKGTELQGALLHATQAQLADFTGANLSQVKAYNADFKYAKFTNAKLTLARMHDSAFRWGHFQNADMNNAEFSGSDFRASDISNATALHTNFENCDFTDSIGDVEIIYTDFNPTNICCTKTRPTVIESRSSGYCDWGKQQACEDKMMSLGMRPSDMHFIHEPNKTVSNPDPQMVHLRIQVPGEEKKPLFGSADCDSN